MNADGIARLFQPWEGARGILLAVSGGPDSMALMHLAARWAANQGRPWLHAATVDHGLRKEAREEAKLVAASAEKLGIPHKTLRWRGGKPATGIQEKAREARYQLLFAHAEKIGADVVMTAHHADDQAETILFRLLRGSGISGLAGMKVNARRDGVLLARPLLGMRKRALIALCQSAGQAFVEDPSNADSRYARTGLRSLLADLESRGIAAPDWTRLGKRLARADAALTLAAREAAKRTLVPGPAGIALTFCDLAGEAEEIRLRVLADALEQAGAKMPLPLEKLESLQERLQEAANSGSNCAATLGGIKLRLDKNGVISFSAEGPRQRGLANKQPKKRIARENPLSLLK